MGISINTGFDLRVDAEALDSRCLYKELADMAAATVGIYDGCICYVQTGDGKGYYNFHATNDLDPDLGKWRPFNPGSGDVIDDSINAALDKTYSITKIKELLNKNGGYVCVDTLPDLSNPDVIDTIMLNKIYLVPSTKDPTEEGNAKEEWICIFTEATEAVMRETKISDETAYNDWKSEITTYVTTGGGSIGADYATYQAANASTTMDADTYAEIVESINASDTDFTAYTSRVTAIELVPAQGETYKWEHFGTLSGDAGLEFSENVIVSNPQGKLKEGTNVNGMTVLEVLEKIITKEVKASISLALTPTNKASALVDKVFEKGASTISDVTLDATINLGTCKIAAGTNVIFKKAGVAISTQPYQEGTLNYTFTDTGANITDSTEYSVEVEYTLEDNSTDTAIDKEKYTFALPIYYGASATKVVADPTTLTKLVELAGVQSLSFTAANGYCVLAIPSTYSLTKILDQNGFDNTSAFDKAEVIVNVGSSPINYAVYTNKNAVTCTNFKYTFTITG